MPNISYNELKTTFEPDELLALAKLDIENKDIESALLKLKILLTHDEPPFDAMSVAARLYAQIGLFDRARTWYEKIVEQKPGATIESFQLGMTYFDSGDSDKALETWNNVLASEPVHPPALFYTGLALAQKGQVADAKQSLDTLLQSAPSDNLYFAKAKELLGEINTSTIRSTTNSAESGTVLPHDAYQTEH